MLTPLQASAALTLWRSGKFDTLDIAMVLRLTEADAVFVLDVLRDHDLTAACVILPFPNRNQRPLHD